MSHTYSKINYNTLVNSRQTRASIVNLSADGKNFEWDNKENILYFLPNFQIENDEIQLNNFKPQEEQEDDLKILPYLKYNEYLVSNKISIEKGCKAVGQIIAIFIKKCKTKILYSTTATFSILKLNESNLIGLTVYHLQNKYPSEKFYKYYFIHFSEKSYYLTPYVSEKLKNIDDSCSIPEHFIKLSKKNNFEFFQVEMDKSFLELRMNFLLINQNSDILLDPEYNLQPMPSCDLMVFRLNLSVLDFIKENKCYVDISSDSKFENKICINSNLSLSDEGIYFLCGYQSGSYNEIDFNDDEYKMTLSEKHLPNIDMGYIVGDHKSLGIIKFSKFNYDGIFTFLGTTTQGSSGSIILNSNGKAIGISFGNYNDYEKKGVEKFFHKYDSFDVLVNENVINYKRSKNTNLGISIFHPLLKIYLNNYESSNNNNFIIPFYGKISTYKTIFHNASINIDELNKDENKEKLIKKKVKLNCQSNPIMYLRSNKNIGQINTGETTTMINKKK